MIRFLQEPAVTVIWASPAFGASPFPKPYRYELLHVTLTLTQIAKVI